MWSALTDNGYTIVTNAPGLAALQPGVKAVAIHPRLPRSAAMPYARDAREGDIPLKTYVERAIELLDNPDGFFLMVEGGQIDWAGHENDAAAMASDILALDEALEVAVDWAAPHADETLIIVISDHETGGMSLGNTVSASEFHPRTYLAQQSSAWSFYTEHISPLLLASGDEPPPFSKIKPLLTSAFGLAFEPTGHGDHLLLSDLEILNLMEAWLKTIDLAKTGAMGAAGHMAYGKYDPLTVTALRILDSKAGIGWTTFHHTATPVPLSAAGVGAGELDGITDNTEIAHVIRRAMGLTAATVSNPDS